MCDMILPYTVGATITRQSGLTRDRIKIPTPTIMTVENAHPTRPPSDFGICANFLSLKIKLKFQMRKARTSKSTPRDGKVNPTQTYITNVM
jgi:hypothetical protein